MAVISDNLVLYASANMPQNDSNTSGGSINSGVRVTFSDPSPAAQVIVFSSSASDTSQTLALVGRNPAGSIVTESLSLDGTTNVTSSNTFERLLTADLSAGAVGVITVSGNGVNKIADIPIGESGFLRPFYDATSSASSSKTLYEKIFVKNNNTSSTLDGATLIPVAATGLASQITYGMENGKGSPQSVSDRTTAPTGVDTFGSGASGVYPNGTGNLVAHDYQGFWLKLSLEANESAINSFYDIQVSGTTS